MSNMVELKAGKMYMDGDLVYPDKRKGLIYVYRSDDSLIHFCWKDRQTGTTEDDFILFPDDVDVKKLEECQTGRVYLLKFKSSKKKHFFWMQEPKIEKDEDGWKKIIDILNGDNQGISGSDSELTPGQPNFMPDMSNVDLGNINDSDLQTLLGGLNRNQLVQLLSSNIGNLGNIFGFQPPQGAGGGVGFRSRKKSAQPLSASSAILPPPLLGDDLSATESLGITPINNLGGGSNILGFSRGNILSASKNDGNEDKTPNKIELSLLQNVLSNIAEHNQKSGNFNSHKGQDEINKCLGQILRPEVIEEICGNDKFVRALLPFLPSKPEGYQINDKEYLKENIRSPQFKQAFSSFCLAFQSGQLTSLMKEFGFSGKALSASQNGDWDAFIKALEEKYDEEDAGTHKME